MIRCTRIGCMVAMLLLTQGCVSAAKHRLSERDRDQQRELTSTWETAANARNFKAIEATYTHDAILLPPNGAMVQGRKNIADFFAAFPTFSDMKLNLVEIDGCNDMALVRGTYSMTFHFPDHPPFHDAGKYLEIRRRQPDGSWLISHDMFSSDVPASH